MSIRMIGIDHNRAEVALRGLFSFTKKSAASAMEAVCGLDGVCGCVILSTCNRMEIWVDETREAAVYEELCRLKRVEPETFREVFVSRTGTEAVEHLFRLTCGMESQILGEDQILTQVKDALALSRENNFTDSTLEVLFRMAVTAGKQVKTRVVFPHGSVSAIQQAVESLQKQGFKIEGSRCMVIGNGQMGILSAKAFRAEGAQVYMTVRRYHHGQAEIPKGCRGIAYEEREKYLAESDYIVSATSSPHYTLTKEMFLTAGYGGGAVLIDLAVPRDISEDVKELEGVTLFDIDDFESEGGDAGICQAMEKAERILGEYMTEFYNWQEGKDLVPRIQMIKEEAAEDVLLRLQKRIRKTSLDEAERDTLQKQIESAAQKVVNKMLFGLKEYLSPEEFQNCVNGLERLYGEE